MDIEKLRLKRRLTQDGLASLCGVHQTAISKWEAGERRPSWPKVLLLADALRVSPLDLADALDVPLTASQRREAS